MRENFRKLHPLRVRASGFLFFVSLLFLQDAHTSFFALHIYLSMMAVSTATFHFTSGMSIMHRRSSVMIHWFCLFLLISDARAFCVAPSSAGACQRTATTPLRASTTSTPPTILTVGERVGRGSYGTVHLCELGEETVIGKRAFTLQEMKAKQEKDPQGRAKRCRYYWDVERHCVEKIPPHPQIPPYRGVFKDEDGNEWMTFDVIQSKYFRGKCCPTMQTVMDDDWKVQHEGETHHLSKLQEALGLPESESSFSETLDCVMESLLQVLSHVHSQGRIVHRDVKPGNLLIDSESHSLVLIDFGSAADMDPVPKKSFFGGTKRVGLEDNDRVAISPIYCAPELFIQPDRYVLQ